MGSLVVDCRAGRPSMGQTGHLPIMTVADYIRLQALMLTVQLETHVLVTTTGWCQ